MEGTNLLEMLNITKTYGSRRGSRVSPVIRDISLTLKQGERIGIIGPSGCGKTTLLRLIAGLDKPDGGKIIIKGKTASDSRLNMPPHQRGVAYVFQSPALWPHMTVEENVRYPSRGDKINIPKLLESFEISELAGRFPSQISGGQARRAALARALASERDLLLMDEPLTNLDRALKKDILKVLRNYLEGTNSGLIYVTHDEEELGEIVSKTYTLTDGVLHNA